MLVVSRVEDQFLQQVEGSLKSKAILVRETVAHRAPQQDLQENIQTLGTESDLRITLVGPEGAGQTTWHDSIAVMTADSPAGIFHVPPCQGLAFPAIPCVCSCRHVSVRSQVAVFLVQWKKDREPLVRSSAFRRLRAKNRLKAALRTEIAGSPMIKVAILGGSGYTAAELIKILLRHPQMNLTAVTTRQISERIGEDPTGLGETSKEAPLLSELHPSLTGRINLRCESFDPDRLLARGVQCVFGCLPHGVSRTALPALLHRGVRVIDLSADYRLRDANVYAQWYGESHGDLAHLAQAVYGLPEIYGEEIAAAQLVANPGCYPQTAILGLVPLV